MGAVTTHRCTVSIAGAERRHQGKKHPVRTHIERPEAPRPAYP